MIAKKEKQQKKATYSNHHQSGLRPAARRMGTHTSNGVESRVLVHNSGVTNDAPLAVGYCQLTATPPVVVNTPPAAEGSTTEKSATTSTTETQTPPVVNPDGSVAAGSKTTTTRDTTMEKKRP